MICNLADRLWKELFGGSKPDLPLKVTHIGLCFHGIETMGVGQQHIHGFLQTKPNSPEKPKSASKRKRDDTSGHQTGDATESPDSSVQGRQWKCPKCKEVITVPQTTDEFGNDEEDAQTLTVLRTVHEDGHYAEKLAKELDEADRRPPLNPSGAGGSSPKKKKKRKKEEGLLRFFDSK